MLDSLPRPASSLPPLRVCLVTGSPSAGRCGVHDYVLALSRALRKLDIAIEIMDHRDWSARGTHHLSRSIRKLRPDILHVQYPMIVGWRSFGPHALGFLTRAPQIVTLHEFSSFDRVRRASIAAFVHFANTIAMTTEFETISLLDQFPRARKKTVTIPIGSNIPFLARAEPCRGKRAVSYFGQIKPLKGLEQFVELARLSAQRKRPWSFRIIGSPVAWAADYLAHLQQQTNELPVEWLLGLDDDQSAHALADSSAAYLPYPDGISERRGSLIAALGNGVPVISTRATVMPDGLAQTALFADSPARADELLSQLFAHPEREEQMRRAGREYVAKFDWHKIASAYLKLYGNIANSTSAHGYSDR